MFLDIRQQPYEILGNLPQVHTFIASSELDGDIAVPIGSTTGDFPHFDEENHIAEGFLPLTENKPDFNSAYQYLDDGEIIIAEDGRSAIKYFIVVTIDIATIKSQKIEQITNLRKTEDKQQVTYTVDGTDYLMHANDKTFNNLTGFVKRLMLNGITTNNWYFDDGKALAVNLVESQNMLKLIADRQQVLRDVAATHGAVINDFSDHLDIVNYDFSTGW